MAEKAASNDSDLFGDINIPELEETLLTVDVAPVEEVAKAVKEVATGGGEPGTTEKKPPEGSGDEPEEKVEELLTVDDGVKPGATEADKQAAKTEKEKSEEGSTSSKENESPVYLHAASLQEQGVLPDFDLKDLKDLDPAQSILKINEHIQSQMQVGIDEGINEFKETLGEKALAIVDAVEKGVPLNDAAQNYSMEQQFDGVTAKSLEDNVDLQTAVYTDFLSLKGFSEAKVKKMVAVAVEKEELLTEAADGLVEIKSLIQDEKANQLKVATQRKEETDKRSEKTKTEVSTTVNAVKEIFPGIAVTEAEKKGLIKNLTTPVRFVKRPDGRKAPISRAMDIRSKNPIAYELRLNYLIDKGFFDDDMKNIKLETFLANTETSATKKFIEKLSGEKASISGEATSVVEANKAKEASEFIFPQNLT